MHDCEKCDGTGRISCGACWNGNRKAICPDCSGRGQIEGKTCTRCHGRAKVTPMSCPTCGNSLPCSAC